MRLGDSVYLSVMCGGRNRKDFGEFPKSFFGFFDILISLSSNTVA